MIIIIFVVVVAAVFVYFKHLMAHDVSTSVNFFIIIFKLSYINVIFPKHTVFTSLDITACPF